MYLKGEEIARLAKSFSKMRMTHAILPTFERCFAYPGLQTEAAGFTISDQVSIPFDEFHDFPGIFGIHQGFTKHLRTGKFCYFRKRLYVGT